MKKKLYSKKGQMTQSSVATIIALVIGMGIAVIVLIFVSTLGGQTYELVEPDINAMGTTDVINQSFIASNVTAVSLGNYPIHVGSLTILNDSVAVGLGNFTVTYATGELLLTGNGQYNATALNATYTYGNDTIPDHIRKSVISSFEALEKTGDLMPVIVMTVIVVIVIGLIYVGMLGNKGYDGGRGTAL